MLWEGDLKEKKRDGRRGGRRHPLFVVPSSQVNRCVCCRTRTGGISALGLALVLALRQITATATATATATDACAGVDTGRSRHAAASVGGGRENQRTLDRDERGSERGSDDDNEVRTETRCRDVKDRQTDKLR